MNENDIKNVISALFDSLTKIEDEEVTNDLGDKFDKLINSGYNLKDMEDFDVLIKYKLDNALRVLIGKLNPEVTDSHKLYKLYFLYNHYNYLDNSLSNFISQKEGRFCCVDKSRWLIKKYKEYILEGKIPDMTIDEKCYWKPHWGTGQQWMNLCEGLLNFYYGIPQLYFDSLKELI